MMENYYINIPFNNSNAKFTIFNNFNYEIVSSFYNSLNDDCVPMIYNFMYKYIKSLKTNFRPVIFTPDYSISSASVVAMAEKFLVKVSDNDIQKYISDMKILYFTPMIHLDKLEKNNIIPQNLSKSILSNLFDDNELSFTNHNFIIQPENITIIGVNDKSVSEEDIIKLNEKNITFYTLSNIKKRSIEKISKLIHDRVGDSPVYVIYDMSVLNFTSAPSVFRLQEISELSDINGLSSEEMISFFAKLKTLNIVGLDITGFNLNNKVPDISFKITSESAKLPLIHLLELKEKKINVFNQFTKILICKPITKEQKDMEERKFILKQFKNMNFDLCENLSISDSDDEKCVDNLNDDEFKEIDDNGNDHGWYIMRNVPTETKEELIQKLMEIENNIMFYNSGEDSMYISFTTISEQEQKSYVTSISIYDKVLVPDEKVNLMFSQL